MATSHIRLALGLPFCPWRPASNRSQRSRVQPGDAAVVDAYRDHGVDLAGETAVRLNLVAAWRGVAMINAANRLGVIVHQKGGSYEPGMFASMTE